MEIEKRKSKVKKLYEDEYRRAEQLSLNCKWLINRMDEIFYAICPDRMGTWQQRAEMAVQKAKELSALKDHNIALDKLIALANGLRATHNGSAEIIEECVAKLRMTKTKRDAPKQTAVEKSMDVKKAIEKIREYWPDTKDIMWGGALETICAQAIKFTPEIEERIKFIKDKFGQDEKIVILPVSVAERVIDRINGVQEFPNNQAVQTNLRLTKEELKGWI